MTPKDDTTWEQLCAFAESSFERNKVPGSIMGILENGEIKAASFGVTNHDHPLEVTEGTLFQIGSITKTFTGTLIMKLVEAGKIDLDATVISYLPDFKVADEEATRSATVRHLLTHTSGWFGDFFFDTGPGEEAIARYVEGMFELEQLAPLGKVWSYNNAGFSLAGRIVEVVTQKTYQEALKEMILEPLGLQNTFFDPGDLITYRFAVGHNGGEVARPWPLPHSAYPAGGITCSIHDLLTYAKFHLGNGTTGGGEKLLTNESLVAMQTPQTTVWKKRSWGLTWFIDYDQKFWKRRLQLYHRQFGTERCQLV